MKSISKRFRSLTRAGRHPVVMDKPAPNFFEGALLGNGGLGVVVCTRPYAVVLRFGHNNVWDIRLNEEYKDEIGTFKEVFERVKAVPATASSLSEDQWCRQYFQKMITSYTKSYPRPFPCGSLILGFDRRKAEMLGHRVDIATGVCEVRFQFKGGTTRSAESGTPIAASPTLQIFVEMDADRVWLRMSNAPFDRIRLLPDPATPKDLPAYTVAVDALSFRQVMSFQENCASHPKDRAFRLTAQTNTALEVRTRMDTWSGLPETMGTLERGMTPTGDLIVCVQLDEGLAADVSVAAVGDCQQPDNHAANGGHQPPLQQQAENALRRTEKSWRKFWNRSGVALDDPVLERTWYQNLYFLNCAVKSGATCPGLFANWSYGNIGTAWHGDYHMNYNTQQPFWVTFSSNHVDKNLAYVEMVERVLPLEQKWAREYYGLRGAFGMHSLYPVEMITNPFPVPDWGWEICETPWTMQGLWWHYLYTQDKAFLERRAFGPIREAVLFLVDYMKRPDAHGAQWGDDKYHIFPTVPPELYGLRPGFKFNHDCLVDLTLTKFIFRAFLEAGRILGCDEPLATDVRDILAHFPDYPTAGDIFVSVTGENPNIVYNSPNSVMTVFPGEDHGLHSPPTMLAIAQNSYRQQRNEGGNDLVFLNLAGARLGLLDLEKFRRQIEYCRLPNGTYTNRCLQTHGRYQDVTDFDFMSPMGIWFENFALPVVINECLLQSYNGVIRLFPNWPAGQSARFHTLRAVGAFLVSAATGQDGVEWIEIDSEAGQPLRLINPWTGQLIERDTKPGETIYLTPPGA